MKPDKATKAAREASIAKIAGLWDDGYRVGSREAFAWCARLLPEGDAKAAMRAEYKRRYVSDARK